LKGEINMPDEIELAQRLKLYPFVEDPTWQEIIEQTVLRLPEEGTRVM
jgi:hypothetical protein